MATGKKPFSGNNSLMTLDAVLHAKPAPPRELNPKIPIELEGIIGKAMEKDRGRRYQSAAEMRSDLALLKREAESGTIKTGEQHGDAAGGVENLRQGFAAADLFAGGDGGVADHGAGGGGSVVVQTSRSGQCRAAQCDRGAALAEFEWGRERRLSAVRTGGRVVERTHLFAIAGGAAFVGHTQIRCARTSIRKKWGRNCEWGGCCKATS